MRKQWRVYILLLSSFISTQSVFEAKKERIIMFHFKYIGRFNI